MKIFPLLCVLVAGISSDVYAVGEEDQDHRIARIIRQTEEEQTRRSRIDLIMRQTEQAQLQANFLRAQAENNLLIQLGQLNLNNRTTTEISDLLRQLIRQVQDLTPAH